MSGVVISPAQEDGAGIDPYPHEYDVPVLGTPVRYAVYPWTATVTQGQTAGIEGAGGPCELRRLALDCHGKSGVNTQYRRGEMYR